MTMVKIKVIAAFIYNQQVAEVGEELIVAKGFAREVVSANKAVMVAPLPAPPMQREAEPIIPPPETPAAEVTPDPPSPSGRRPRGG